MAEKTTYDQIGDPYDASMMRGNSNATPNGQFASPNGNGSVMEQPFKSDGDSSDVWIKNFIKSVNWNPKKNGFYINGQTGYAEFSNVFVSGDITGSTITGSTISGTNINGGTITGGTIIGGSITGGTISGGTISGGTISGGTISGATITGGTITGSTINGGVFITTGDTGFSIKMTGTTDSISFLYSSQEIANIASSLQDNLTDGQLLGTSLYAGDLTPLEEGTGYIMCGGFVSGAQIGKFGVTIGIKSGIQVLIVQDSDSIRIKNSLESLVGELDLREISSFQLPILGAPAGATDGALVYDDNTDELMVLKNGTWRTVTTS